MSISKVNDLSDSPLRRRFFESEFVPENNNAISCIRISGKKQEEGSSPQDQDETNVLYAKREKLVILKPYEFTETASKHEKRKQFHGMLNDIRISQNTSKPIKHIIFSFQSRSNRNRFSARELEDLVDLGITLHFARDNRKLTCKADIAQWLMWHVENMKNAAYIDELTKNAIGGHIRCIERGISPIAVPPFGFTSEGRRINRRFVFDGDNARYMKRAFELMIQNETEVARGQYSYKLLKRELDQEFKFLKKNPGMKQFFHLLRNHAYYGDFKFAGTVYKGDPKYHPPLVSKDVWCHVQDILNGRYKKRHLSKVRHYIGLMVCNGKILDGSSNVTAEICGCSITAETIRKTYKNGDTQEFHYYRCSNTEKRCSQRDKQYMKSVVGRNVSYRDSEVEEIFENMFKSFSFDDVTCQRMKKHLWDEHFAFKSKDHDSKHRLEARRIELDAFIEKSYEDKLTGKISEELWLKNNHKWRTEKEQISAELAALDDLKEEYMQQGVNLIELMQHSEIVYKTATPNIKRQMVATVSSNLLLADGTLEYDWKMPYRMLAINGDFGKWLGD